MLDELEPPIYRINFLANTMDALYHQAAKSMGIADSALIAKILGEGNRERAQDIFSLVVFATIACGCIIAILSIIFLRPIASFLGADGAMLEKCVSYGRIILAVLPFLMLQYAFSSLVVTAQRARLGLVITVAAGLINAVGDVLFMVVLHWEIEGAALASALGELAGGVVPLVYFARKNSYFWEQMAFGIL